MTNEERYQKYINENCKNCKHHNEQENLCDIRIIYWDGITTTRCLEYARED